MTLLNEMGSRASLTLPAVRDYLIELEVSEAMGSIISNNIFTSSGGDLVTKYSAQITERTVTALEVR
jgi:hypothetical protein